MYFGNWLTLEMGASASEMRRAGLKRFYFYILSLLGLGATFISVVLLANFLIDFGFGNVIWGGGVLRELSGSLSTLLVGLPLWVRSWMPMQTESATADDAGDHARTSLVRRFYLYLVLFVAVIGVMGSAIWLVYILLNTLLSGAENDFVIDLLRAIVLLAEFSVLLYYHFSTLRADGNKSADSIEAKHRRFGVIVLDAGDGAMNGVASALKKILPDVPVTFHAVTESLTNEMRANAKAVVIPTNLALTPPEALRLWLQEFKGEKIMTDANAQGWVASGLTPQQTAQAVRALAEGQEYKAQSGTPAWVAVAYVFAAIFAIQLIFILIAVTASFIGGGF
jgi:nitrate reductase NapE component